MLLLAEVDIVLEKKSYKKNMIRSFYSNNSKIVFALLIEVITSHIIVTVIIVKKANFK